MSVYKQVRKTWLKQLTKVQKKELKRYIQDIADDMLHAYSDTIRIKRNASLNVSHYLPIDGTEAELIIRIKLENK